MANGVLTPARTFAVVPQAQRGAQDFIGDVAFSPDGRLLYAANLYRDSISVVNPQSGMVIGQFKTGRRPSFRWFSPTDNLAERQFYTLNPAAIGAAVGIANPEPLTLIELGPATPAVYPVPAQQLPRPPNNHLSYVITWYGLAVALIIIFIVWIGKAPQS